LNRLVLREVAFTDAVAQGLARIDGDAARSPTSSRCSTTSA